MTRVNTWIGAVASTNFKTLSGIALDFLTFFWVAWPRDAGHAINETALGMWLAFLAALNGIAYQQFSKQRTSDYGAMERQAEIERAKSAIPPDVTVITPAQPTVTVTATSSTEDKG